MRDLLGFINVVIMHPEALNLTTEAVTSLTMPIVVPLLSNGSMNTNFTDGEGFAKGVSAFGSPGEPHGVKLLKGICLFVNSSCSRFKDPRQMFGWHARSAVSKGIK